MRGTADQVGNKTITALGPRRELEREKQAHVVRCGQGCFHEEVEDATEQVEGHPGRGVGGWNEQDDDEGLAGNAAFRGSSSDAGLERAQPEDAEDGWAPAWREESRCFRSSQGGWEEAGEP